MPGACGDAPVWGAEYTLPDLYEKSLLLPADFTATVHDAHPCERWAATLNAPVLVVKNVARARRLILEALNLRGKTVALDANASVDVVSAVKRHGAQIQFRALSQAFGQDEARGSAGVDVADADSGWGVDSVRFLLPIPVIAVCGDSLPIVNPYFLPMSRCMACTFQQTKHRQARCWSFPNAVKGCAMRLGFA
ncbi:MAG: hypothetical protein IPJ47_12560 [Anaerolineales bacterium]|nr:hypothetical protein [Anaerolineales bacterium]